MCRTLSEMSVFILSDDKNASRKAVRLSSVSCSDDAIIGIAVVVGMSSSGSSVGSIILLFFRWGGSIFVGLSFFVLCRIVINLSGIVGFDCVGCFVFDADFCNAICDIVVFVANVVDGVVNSIGSWDATNGCPACLILIECGGIS